MEAGRPALLANDAAAWSFSGRLCYRNTPNWLLMGLLGEGSAYGSEVYGWRVVMPLFVPQEHLVLSYSQRVGGGRRYTSAELAELVPPLIRGPWDEEAELHRLAALDASTNAAVAEVAGYAAVLLDDWVTAAGHLALASASTTDNRDWMQEQRRRSAASETLLPDRHLLLQRMRAWRKSTLAALGIEGSRSLPPCS